MAAEMQRMRQQLELMQAELLCARTGSAPEEVQLLKQKIVWLEASNSDMRQELKEARSQIQDLSEKALEARVCFSPNFLSRGNLAEENRPKSALETNYPLKDFWNWDWVH
ncbi:hypothetical protein Mapa_010099 [Marchantia paleacea]|nr:hypothetical protein Mapa_010099 [Marchantia paleacea]